MPEVTRELARFAAETRWQHLPASVQREGPRAFLNWVGCALGGADEGNMQIALDALAPFSGSPQATVVGRSVRVDILLAAMLNAISSSVHSFNDTHFETVAHPTSPVGGALLALAEHRPISGRDGLLALLIGNEVQCRVGLMLVRPPAECGVGLSTQGLLGTIGAAVAAAKAMGLDAEAMGRAIGIAANQSAGIREAHASMSSHFTPGNSARGGLQAALLAQKGYQCTPTMLEGVKGFGAAFARNPQPDAAVEGLGTQWEVMANGYKPYPCGFVIHPATDACIDIARSEAIDPARIERIEADVNPLTIALCDRARPTDRRQAIVSVQHWMAVALLTGKAGLKQGDEAAVADPRVARLRGLVKLIPSEAVGREAVTVRVVLQDGRTLTKSVAHCRGSIGRPMTDGELEEKFRAQAELVFAAPHVDELYAACLAIETAPDLGAFAKRLAT